MPLQGKEKILLVRFPATRAGAASEVYLWDEPFLSTYFIRLPKGLLAEPERAAELLPKVARIAEPDQWQCSGSCVHGIRFTLYEVSSGHILGEPAPAPGSRPQMIAVAGVSQMRQSLMENIRSSIGIWLHENPSATWLSYTLGKKLFEKPIRPR
jgi:hypothetical protein